MVIIMKKKTVVVSVVLFLVLACGIAIYARPKHASDKEEYLAEVLLYLEGQKTAMENAESIPLETDPQTGRVIEIHTDNNSMIDKTIALISRADEVKPVKSLPPLEYPLVYIGDKLRGNNERLYFFRGSQMIEFTLKQTDQIGYLIYLTGAGAVYPQVRATITDAVIGRLQKEIALRDEDTLIFNNGCFEAIEIETQESSEQLFQCIRNCVQIMDLTDVSLEPMELPIQINGQGVGTYQAFFTTYPETNQYIGIYFSSEDSECFYNYVMGLQ